MSWRSERTQEGSDFVWDGVEKGIAVSPTQGTANIQNANISTETGEVMASYGRLAQQQAAIVGGTLTASVPDGATLFAAPATLKAGAWVLVSASTVSGITASTGATTATGNYLVVGGGAGGGFATGSAGEAGGGGGGRVLPGTNAFSVGSYAVTIGDGGAGGASAGAAGTDGNSSILAGVATAPGGGGGGGTTTKNGRAGASGGGGASLGSPGTGGTGTGGHNGGAGDAGGSSAGGGGGDGTAGTAGTGTSGAAGGNGTASSITGSSVTYGAGGGGGGQTAGGAGGTGGGGNGGAATGTPANAGSNATANSGSGGGGGAGIGSTSANATGGNGAAGLVVISYVTGSMIATGGTVTQSGGNTIHTFLTNGTFQVLYINSGGYYYVSYKDTNNKIKLSANYDPAAAHALTHGTSGTVTFSVVATPGAAIAKATEKYGTPTGNEYRYYMMDSNARVWVYDTGVYSASLLASGVGTTWILPDHIDYSTLGFSGFAILNGWAMVVSHAFLYGKPTTDLGRNFTQLPNSALNNPFPTHSNYAYVGHQGKMYWCDANYIGMLFPTTSFETNIANVQSSSQYSAVTTVGTLTAIVGGSAPYDPGGTRIPAVFFTDQYGTMPTALTEGIVYYIAVNAGAGTFQVYAALTGGSPLDIQTGSSGNQFFNTFYPLGVHAGINGDHSLVTFSGQRVNLPYFETSTCMVEIGNTVMIGGVTNTLYPWNQVDATPSDFIPLPEAGVVSMENVNNTAYILAGNKGNIYISNGSVASHVLKIPDYCAGVPGSPLTYIEPYFTWGDIAYVRGRVYVSILDQTATKAGNTGGVWSFLPAENFSSGDINLALRLENQNSYGDYDGYARLIIPNQEQNAISPQYWTAWQDSYSVATSVFGIDQTSTTPVTQFVIETDLLATGSFLSKDTFQQLEYKLTTPATSGDSTQLYYRLNSTAAWTTCGTVILESANPISGYFPQVFQKTQWVQFRAVCTTNGTTSSSFNRLKQLMLR